MSALFLAHGSPDTAFNCNNITKKWEELGIALPTPSLIIMISAHWLTRGTKITASDNLKTVHDFYGMPEEYYEYHYHAVGNPEFAMRVASDFPFIELDYNQGLDHGSWSILKHMYPKANIPIVQLSIDRELSLEEHIELAKKLTVLKQKNIMLIGSGNIVHNLKRMRMDDTAAPFSWAMDFENAVKTALLNNDLTKLARLPFDEQSGGTLSLPTIEHYLPLLYIAAMKKDSEEWIFPVEGSLYGAISMFSCYF